MRSPMAMLHVRGNIRSVCERLTELLKAESLGRYRRSIRELVGDGISHRDNLQPPQSYSSDATPIKPQRLMKTLSERARPPPASSPTPATVWCGRRITLQPLNRRTRPFALGQTSERRSGTAQMFFSSGAPGSVRLALSSGPGRLCSAPP